MLRYMKGGGGAGDYTTHRGAGDFTLHEGGAGDYTT